MKTWPYRKNTGSFAPCVPMLPPIDLEAHDEL
jgi:hypothetical protein